MSSTTASTSTTTLLLSCHCKTFSQTVHLPATAIPLRSYVCHCDTCRHASGQLVPSLITMPASTSRPADTKGLKAWRKTAEFPRWFCGTCGADCFVDFEGGDGSWFVCVGVVKGVEVDGVARRAGLQGLLSRLQLWVGDARDGGAALWINAGREAGMERWVEGEGGEVLTDQMLAGMVEDGKRIEKQLRDGEDGRDKLKAYCACGLVDLRISRPEDGQKFQAGLDACQSCRLVTGYEITSWAAMPVSSVTNADGSSLDFTGEPFGRYESSPGVGRFFCKGCGATVFYHSDQSDMLDIGVGLLDAAEGSRAGSWLSWTKYGDKQVEYQEDTMDQTFLDQLVAGCRAFPL